MSKTIDVVYYGNQGAEELYKTVGTGHKKVYVRQPANVDKICFWYSSVKWTGGYEADCHIKAGITMRVVDKNGNELFSETLETDKWNGGTSAKKYGPFLLDAIDDLAAECMRHQRLSRHNDWRKWLLEQKPTQVITYDDNWLYCECTTKEETVLYSKEIHGRTFDVIVSEEKHNLCDAEWKCYSIFERGTAYTDKICGYIY